MVKQRIIFGIIMAAAAMLLCWLDSVLIWRTGGEQVQGFIWALIAEAVLITAVNEFSGLVKGKGARVFPIASMAGATLFCLSYFLKQFGFAFGISQAYLHLIIMFAAVLSAVLLSFVAQGRTKSNEGTILNCGATVLTVMYWGFFSSFFLAIRVEHSISALIVFIAVVKMCDVGAYTFGKMFGHTKFAPAVSPKKTWEGMIGGCIFSAVSGAAFSVIFSVMLWWQGVIFGIIFAFAGQLGDLAESMLKRDAGIKDSGDKLPGFGGILDIVDSLVFTAPFAYLFFNIVS
ncbi:phosphatidate cytidylyltransferase [Sedimentisphaera salicampi]|uniref:Phosphatidate cytidylyltransferase n=1 Tax=Sedimentisphaera salicampi TaxID=1941349 RepID=A0A1W6LLZ6_9BACT|nr:phosphatidate cytidylyltransferase [Sedimentisphaera salicampi]ARN56773.1 Phosphatidate cytidylyltransferase [Sedimentisphaera salicampi]OXU15099.1 Phosphatidate cytidylyltransferase [Sedimentisphaera salicampi]